MTTQTILILGTGTMAQEIGLHAVSHGFSVAWTSRNPDRLLDVQPKLARKAARIIANLPEDHRPWAPSFLKPNDRFDHPIDVVIECTVESLPEKRAFLAATRDRYNSNSLLLSNSSSILPSAIDPAMAGLHFFHPVSLSLIVEAIIPQAYDAEKKSKLDDFIKKLDLIPIVENERTAFAANRLLLPLQAESVRAVAEGFDPRVVDLSSKSELLEAGTLSLMDAVGLDVVLAAVREYRSRDDGTLANDLAVMESSIEPLVAQEMLGKKSHAGLVCHLDASESIVDPVLAQRFHSLFVETCRSFVKNGELSPASLNLILTRIFGATSTDAVLQGE